MNRKIFSQKPAYSLILALLMITVVLIIAVSTVTNTQEKLVEIRDIEPSLKAKLAAESAVEQAVIDLEGYGAGYEITTPVVAYSTEEGMLIGEYSVYSKAQQNDNEGTYFYTPIPGTGSAAPSDECSFLEDDQAVDHPCNWNKILYGETVTIPLYSDDGTGLDTLSPFDLGMSSWHLKIRTPCSNETFSEDCDRFELDGDSSDYEEDDTVVFWQLTGEMSDGTTVIVVPDDEVSKDFIISRDLTVNNEIYETLINAALDDRAGTSGTYIVLEADSSSSDDRYVDLYNNCCLESLDFEMVTLSITIVAPLIDADSGESIPYLEWQLASQGTNPPADNKVVISSSGEYTHVGGDVYYYPLIAFKALFGDNLSLYTLSN